MPVTVVKDGRVLRQHVVPDDHPGAMVSWRYDLATAITGEPLEAALGARLAIRTLHPDFGERVNRIDGQVNLIDRNPVSSLSLGRMLAKIAHSYALAKLGPASFTPLLREVILGDEPYYVARFVGGNGALRDRPSMDRHSASLEWQPRIDGKLFLVVTVRLFGDLNLPSCDRRSC
jgi:hypothetical protein